MEHRLLLLQKFKYILSLYLLAFISLNLCLPLREWCMEQCQEISYYPKLQNTVIHNTRILFRLSNLLVPRELVICESVITN